ncbi:hypothetical protein MTR_3g085310 [Medicago truncatula]|uniref:Uncharacterized protein n=1 Tax=Medicago truncatula TaxID=3880 RepID=G7JBY9_MEDTR|nr:hypothetical protein MTR_3g085310 [Medicago truncatula]
MTLIFRIQRDFILGSILDIIQQTEIERREKWCERMKEARLAGEAFGEDAIDGRRALLRTMVEESTCFFVETG